MLQSRPGDPKNPQLKQEMKLRHRAEQSLRESETRYRQHFDDAPTGNFVVRPDGRLLACNPAFASMFGFDSVEHALNAGLEVLFSDRAVWESLVQTLRTCETLQNHELTLRRLHGDSSIVLARLVGQFNRQGHLIAIQGYFQDVTSHRRAEREHRRLSLRLAAVQESERARFSRELHDQIGQEVTGLQLHLQSLVNDPAVGTSTRQQLVRLTGLAAQLTRSVHQIAWELRPSVLDDLGLNKALERYTADWSERSGVLVDYQSSGFTTGWTTDSMVEISIYRIAQEALHNVWNHAQAGHASVLLQQRQNEVRLIVEDNGRGFEVETVMLTLIEQGKLGLLGMRERASLVGGNLHIESTPGQGTAVFFTVSLSNPASA